jgi:hypothetical protein
LSKRNVKLILKILSDLEPLRGSSNKKKTSYSTRSCVNWALYDARGPLKHSCHLRFKLTHSCHKEPNLYTNSNILLCLSTSCREASELSSSGSEKSFRKGFRDNSRNKNKPNFNRKGDSSGDTWNAGASTVLEPVPNAASSTARFHVMNVDQTEAVVNISWFHHPGNFYCQLENTQVMFCFCPSVAEFKFFLCRRSSSE